MPLDGIPTDQLTPEQVQMLEAQEALSTRLLQMQMAAQQISQTYTAESNAVNAGHQAAMRAIGNINNN